MSTNTWIRIMTWDRFSDPIQTWIEKHYKILDIDTDWSIHSRCTSYSKRKYGLTRFQIETDQHPKEIAKNLAVSDLPAVVQTGPIDITGRRRQIENQHVIFGPDHIFEEDSAWDSGKMDRLLDKIVRERNLKHKKRLLFIEMLDEGFSNSFKASFDELYYDKGGGRSSDYLWAYIKEPIKNPNEIVENIRALPNFSEHSLEPICASIIFSRAPWPVYQYLIDTASKSEMNSEAKILLCFFSTQYTRLHFAAPLLDSLAST